MKLRAPSWSRIRPNPATATIQAPANLGDVQAVAGVVLQVVEIHESGLGEVVIRVDVGADRYSDRPSMRPFLRNRFERAATGRCPVPVVASSADRIGRADRS